MAMPVAFIGASHDTHDRVPRRASHNKDWSALSLSQAMRGMETEQTSYSSNDIKEMFS